MTGKILSALPPESTVFHYGNLETKPVCDINTGDLIFHKKELEGWWLASWVNSIPKERFLGAIKTIITEITKEDSNLFDTKISKRYKFSELNEAREW